MNWKVGLVVTVILAAGGLGVHLLQDYKSDQLVICQQDCDETLSDCLTDPTSRTLSCETLHFMCNIMCGGIHKEEEIAQ